MLKRQQGCKISKMLFFMHSKRGAAKLRRKAHLSHRRQTSLMKIFSYRSVEISKEQSVQACLQMAGCESGILALPAV